MVEIFAARRVGRPQVAAGLLLLTLLAQSLWLVRKEWSAGIADPVEVARLQSGLKRWRGAIASSTQDASFVAAPGVVGPGLPRGRSEDEYHSPLPALINSAPFLMWPSGLQPQNFRYSIWLARIPSLLFALALGASIWYVARRLYGDSGGYIALTLFCFSPVVIRCSASWFTRPEMGAAWAAFGAIFTAIAVAHTLYAPREVVLWNWKRILLLGLSLALAVGSQFSLLILAPVTLLFMFYVAPDRRLAALAIWMAACVFALGILFASYGFRSADFSAGMRNAKFSGIAWPSFATRGIYRQFGIRLFDESPSLTMLLPIAIATYLAWPRTRYFGNTAPLLVAILCLFLGLGSAHFPGMGFQWIAIPFLYLFIAGIGADLLETAYHHAVWVGLWGLIAAYSLWNVIQLAKLA